MTVRGRNGVWLKTRQRRLRRETRSENINGSSMNGTEPPLTLLAEGAEYMLRADTDGAAYILSHKLQRLTAHLHNEDDARFRADYVTLIQQFPDWRADQTLAQLWDQGGYSWLATEDGGDNGDAG